MSTTHPAIDPALADFVAGAQAIVDAYMAEHFPTLDVPRLVVEPGRRYARIVSERRPRDRSVFAFVDLTTGDVLKPETWHKPARHARGNVFDDSHGLARIGPYGPAYLR